MEIFRRFTKNLPTLLLAFALAVAAWVSAVTSADPNEQRVYPNTIPIQMIGQDPALILLGDHPTQVKVTLKAPKSVLDELASNAGQVTATVNLADLKAGTHTLPVQVQIGMRPVEIVSISPRTLNLTLENLETQDFDIKLVRNGDPAVGFQAETPVLGATSVTVSGPQSLVERITEVRATIDLSQARESINRSVPLKAVDENGAEITGITLSPSEVNVNQKITQRGGYRMVVVKVVTTGKVSSGYRLTNISAAPWEVMVYSANPDRVNELPGYVETLPVNLDGAKDDLDQRVQLNLPAEITVVGDQSVQVQVGIAAIESSLTLSNKLVEIIGLEDGLTATISPQTVDVILSGPLPVLDILSSSDVRVIIDLTGKGVGVYQLTPRIEIQNPDLQVESILPGTLEVSVVSVAR